MEKNTTEISYVWNGGPAERGTADLIYSCLFTIFICTWNAVHMNVPADDDGPVMTVLRKAKWMLIAVIAPDLIALRSMAEFLSAWTLKTAMRKHMARRGVDGEWTLTHAFLAIMGGISLSESEGSRQRLDSSRLLELIRTGVLEMPHISREMIDDKSKVNWVLRSIAIFQVVGFGAHLIGRAVQKLPVTTLELFTVATVTCAVFTSGCWWKKPYDLRVPFTVPSTLTMEQLSLEQNRYYRERRGAEKRFSLTHRIGINFSGLQRSVFAVVTAILCAVFGAIHAAAWNFYFNTDAERWLWRIASCLCGALPTLLLGRGVATGLRIKTGAPKQESQHILGEYLIMALYVLVRMYLLAEIFLSLRAVPLGVYEIVHWANYIPHL